MFAPLLYAPLLTLGLFGLGGFALTLLGARSLPTGVRWLFALPLGIFIYGLWVMVLDISDLFTPLYFMLGFVPALPGLFMLRPRRLKASKHQIVAAVICVILALLSLSVLSKPLTEVGVMATHQALVDHIALNLGWLAQPGVPAHTTFGLWAYVHTAFTLLAGMAGIIWLHFALMLSLLGVAYACGKYALTNRAYLFVFTGFVAVIPLTSLHTHWGLPTLMTLLALSCTLLLARYRETAFQPLLLMLGSMAGIGAVINPAGWLLAAAAGGVLAYTQRFEAPMRRRRTFMQFGLPLVIIVLPWLVFFIWQQGIGLPLALGHHAALSAPLVVIAFLAALWGMDKTNRTNRTYLLVALLPVLLAGGYSLWRMGNALLLPVAAYKEAYVPHAAFADWLNTRTALGNKVLVTDIPGLHGQLTATTVHGGAEAHAPVPLRARATELNYALQKEDVHYLPRLKKLAADPKENAKTLALLLEKGCITHLQTLTLPHLGKEMTYQVYGKAPCELDK